MRYFYFDAFLSYPRVDPRGAACGDWIRGWFKTFFGRNKMLTLQGEVLSFKDEPFAWVSPSFPMIEEFKEYVNSTELAQAYLKRLPSKDRIEAARAKAKEIKELLRVYDDGEFSREIAALEEIEAALTCGY